MGPSRVSPSREKTDFCAFCVTEVPKSDCVFHGSFTALTSVRASERLNCGQVVRFLFIMNKQKNMQSTHKSMQQNNETTASASSMEKNKIPDVNPSSHEGTAETPKPLQAFDKQEGRKQKKQKEEVKEGGSKIVGNPGGVVTRQESDKQEGKTQKKQKEEFKSLGSKIVGNSGVVTPDSPVKKVAPNASMQSKGEGRKGGTKSEATQKPTQNGTKVAKQQQTFVKIEVQNGFVIPSFFNTASTIQKSCVLALAGEAGASIVSKLTEKSGSEQVIKHMCDQHLKLESLMCEKYEQRYEELAQDHRATLKELGDLRKEKDAAASVTTEEELEVTDLECIGSSSKADAHSKEESEKNGPPTGTFMQQHFAEMFKLYADHAALVELASKSMDAIRAKEVGFYEACKADDSNSLASWQKLPFEDGLNSMRHGVSWNNISKKQKEGVIKLLGKRTADSVVGVNEQNGKKPKQ